LLELADVHTYYGESHILHGVTLALQEGQVISLLGRNGMGKTTTIRSISGLTPPRQGSIQIDGRDVTGMRSYKIARLGVGVVPQGRRIFPSLSVRENLMLGARGGGGEGGWDLDRVHELFPILEQRAAVKGTLLSGGEQQMLAIARALMTNPKLLLMDEPSEGLAPIVIEEIAAAIKKLGAGSMSILLVEQNLPLALDVADHVYVMSKGRIVHDDTPASLARDDEVKARYLGAAGELDNDSDPGGKARVAAKGG
jgi:branched-chain amino acid transport system ATP-binding protein